MGPIERLCGPERSGATEAPAPSSVSTELAVRSRLYPRSEYVTLVQPARHLPSDLRAGLILDGRYRLHERLGMGGTATVYRARDLRLGIDVAVKIMHEVLAGDQVIVERFHRESRTAEALQHRNIVRAFDHGSSDGMHYIVMEYVRGPSLKTLIASEAPLEPTRAIALTLQILAATRFIHDQGIMHRDLKPGNVLVSAAGLAKITDFGIARAGATDITPVGSLMGTVHYLSPERVSGAAATEASDVYSIGIILYELLTGCLPFDGELVATVVRQHLNDRPLPPACVNGAVTSRLNAIVLRALEKSPQARIGECGTFAAALRRELGRLARTSRLRSLTSEGAVAVDAA